MSFRDYRSKPIMRKAHRIGRHDGLLYDPVEMLGYVNIDGENVKFKAFDAPVVGDFVVYNGPSDIYHCNYKVFCERNIVGPQ